MEVPDNSAKIEEACENGCSTDVKTETKVNSESSEGCGKKEDDKKEEDTATSESLENNASEKCMENATGEPSVEEETTQEQQGETKEDEVEKMSDDFDVIVQVKDDEQKAEEAVAPEESSVSTPASETPTVVPGDSSSEDVAGAKTPSSEVAAAAAFTEGGLTCSEPDLIQDSEPGDSDFIHNVKWINFMDKKLPIITQNANGPCPLIAIVNVLLLSRRLYLPSNINEVTAQQLMDQIGNAILENRPSNMSEEIQHNYEQNMQDAMSILPRLQTGLDVNVKFTGIREFEYTPECIIFDLLNIGLYHGWLVDPQSPDVMAAIGNCGYNQLVEKIITNKTSSRHELVTEALTAEDFLERTGWQLTYHGLCELVTTLREGELAVLFRNNHFSTLYKKKDRLYQLVTDTGFLNEMNMVWETLSSIDGDSQIVDHEFTVVPPKRETRTETTAEAEPPQQQIHNDFMIALSLQEESERAAKTDRAWQEYKEKELGDTGQLSDEELARRLHEEELRMVEMYEQQRSQQGSVDGSQSQTSSSASSSPTGRPRATTPKKKDNCCIL